MADYGRGTLADRRRDDSTSTIEGCLSCFHLSWDDSSFGVVNSSRVGNNGVCSGSMDKDHRSHWGYRGNHTIVFVEGLLGSLPIQRKSRDKGTTGVVEDGLGREGGHTGQENQEFHLV